MAEAESPEASDATVPVSIEVAGQHLVTDVSGTLYWPLERALVLADSHLGKAMAFAQRGWMLPPYDTVATLAALEKAIRRFAPRRVIALGDSLHDGRTEASLAREERTALVELQRGRDWVWIRGNHDPEITRGLGGEVVDGLAIRSIRLVHIPQSGAFGQGILGEIAGHLHPAARLATRGGTIRRRCFVGDVERLVLPALGAFAGGLNVLDEAFRPLFSHRPPGVWMLGRDAVYAVPADRLRPD